MSRTIAEIAAATGLRAEGDMALVVARPAEPAAAGPDDLALAMDKRYEEAAAECRARAAILWEGADWRALGFDAALFAARPKLGLAAAGDAFARPPEIEPGVHPSAVVHPTAELGEDCRIGPFTVVAAGARIGPRARIFGQASIGADATLGADSLLHPGVRIGPRVVIGDRFFAQYNSVVGAEGYSYLTPEPSAAETAQSSRATKNRVRSAGFRRIESLGSVAVGDDVDLGALSVIDRGTISDTTVGRGCKIDNQVTIAHNARVGDDCMFSGQVGIAGSAVIGDRVVMGGKAGCADNCSIGSDVLIGGGCLVGSNVSKGKVMLGIPAIPRDKFIQQQMALRRLPLMKRHLEAVREKLGL